MSKLAHIVAIEINDPDFLGYKKCNPFETLEMSSWIAPRPILETLDPEKYKRDNKIIVQPIPYIIIQHKNEVLAYVRPSVGNETRLHGKVSIGFGGHVDLDDVKSYESIIDFKETMEVAAIRELYEELSLNINSNELNWSGLIRRNDGPVDRVHIGFVVILKINESQKNKLKKSEETGELKFIDINNIPDTFNNYEIESWTKALINANEKEAI